MSRKQLQRLVIYPMLGNNATLKIDFTDPRNRDFVRSLFDMLMRNDTLVIELSTYQVNKQLVTPEN